MNRKTTKKSKSEKIKELDKLNFKQLYNKFHKETKSQVKVKVCK